MNTKQDIEEFKTWFNNSPLRLVYKGTILKVLLDRVLQMNPEFLPGSSEFEFAVLRETVAINPKTLPEELVQKIESLFGQINPNVLIGAGILDDDLKLKEDAIKEMENWLN